MTDRATKIDNKSIGDGERPPTELLDVKMVAAALGISSRQVYRLADCGKIPRPVRLGALVRWRRAELTDWISAGCKAVTTAREVRR